MIRFDRGVNLLEFYCIKRKHEKCTTTNEIHFELLRCISERKKKQQQTE